MSQMFQCPKCHSTMRTYNRNGVQIEQCDTCRGVFLDYGELESIIQMESRMMQPAPAAPPAYGVPQPAWGHGHHYGHRKSFAKMLFSS